MSDSSKHDRQPPVDEYELWSNSDKSDPSRTLRDISITVDRPRPTRAKSRERVRTGNQEVELDLESSYDDDSDDSDYRYPRGLQPFVSPGRTYYGTSRKSGPGRHGDLAIHKDLKLRKNSYEGPDSPSYLPYAPKPPKRERDAIDHRARTNVSHEYDRRLMTRHNSLQPGAANFKTKFVQTHDFDTERRHLLLDLSMPDMFTEFLQNELGQSDSLWDLVILVGYPTQHHQSETGVAGPWATTCGQYIQETWPGIEEQMRNFIEQLQASTLVQESRELLRVPQNGLSVGCERELLPTGKTNLYLKFQGSIDHIPEMLEATIWLFTIVQKWENEGPGACGICWNHRYFTSTSRALGTQLYTLQVDLLEKLVVPHYSACWTTLFPNTPCAIDFPQKKRPSHTRGVEMSFQLMCEICGLDYIVQDEEGLLLFGPSSMVYPVSQAYDCVQWHFQSCQPDDQEGHRITGQRLATLDLESLCGASKRHFLGLWSDPVITLGTHQQDYDNIGYSDAETVEHEYVRDGFSYGATVSIKSIVGASFTQNYKFAASRKPVEMTPLDSCLQSRINDPVLLYCPSERRGWMVSFVSVLWHLLRAQANTKKQLGYKVPPCELAGNGGKAAWECFNAHCWDPARKPAKNQVLRKEEQRETIEDFARDIWRTMDYATRTTCLSKRFFRTSILGFELADIATCNPFMTLRSHTFDFTTKNTWAPLLERVKLTFFYENMPDPILPGDVTMFEGECGKSTWRTIPRNYNLLAVSLPCLAHSARDQNGGRHTISRLAPDWYWHCPQAMFAMCDREERHFCPRLQELQRKANALDPMVPLTIQTGAVVFRFRDNVADIMRSMRTEQEHRLVLHKTQRSEPLQDNTSLSPRSSDFSNLSLEQSESPPETYRPITRTTDQNRIVIDDESLENEGARTERRNAGTLRTGTPQSHNDSQADAKAGKRGTTGKSTEERNQAVRKRRPRKHSSASSGWSLFGTSRRT